jgi:hypothetical protein
MLRGHAARGGDFADLLKQFVQDDVAARMIQVPRLTFLSGHGDMPPLLSYLRVQPRAAVAAM